MLLADSLISGIESTSLQYTIHLFFEILTSLLAIFLILLVLVQRGRGGGIAGALGGMGGNSAFGTKAGDTFTWITYATAAVWIILAMVTIKTFTDPHKEKLEAQNAKNEKLSEDDLKLGSDGPAAPVETTKAKPTDKAEADPVDDTKTAPTDKPADDAKPAADAEEPGTPATDEPATPPADKPAETTEPDEKPTDDKPADEPAVPDPKPDDKPADEDK